MIEPGPVRLCHLTELVDGAAQGFDPLGEGRDAIFIVRQGDSLYGYRNVCPHQGSSLPWRKNAYLSADRCRIVCHAHGAEFDIQTGWCVQGPAMGKALENVPLTTTENGDVVIRDRISTS